MTDDVTDNKAKSRYELGEDGGIAVAAYEHNGDVIAFTHTVVPQQLRGKGVGRRLIKAALADVRRRGLKVRPECAFVADYLERHPEERDLIAT